MTTSAFDAALSELLDARRVTGVSTSNGRVVITVQQLKPDRSGYITQLWDVTTTPVQLTRGEESVSAVEQADDGRLFFLSSREPAAKEPDAPSAAGTQLCMLPTTRDRIVIAPRSCGFSGLRVAERHLAAAMQWHSPAATHDPHEELAATREDIQVSGVVYSQFPTRSWDCDLPAGRT